MGNARSELARQIVVEKLKTLNKADPKYVDLANKLRAYDDEKARTSLDWFARRMLRVEPARHHKLINRELEQVEAGKTPRLMLFLPPGSAKSTYASWNFPAWYLGRNPTKNIIGTSHTAEFSEHWSRKVRDLFMDPLWPFSDVVLSPDSRSVSAWSTNKGGEYFAVGVGGAVTGRRADGAMIDDPIKGRIDADSETVRNRLWEWFLADLHTRLKPGGFIVLIQTRWHEDDLAGRLLGPTYRNQSGDIMGTDGRLWRVVCLPQHAEENDLLGRQPGEVLWPEWYSPEHIAAEKKTLGERNWSALHQQRPSPDEGTIFKRDWLRYYQLRDLSMNRPDEIPALGIREDGALVMQDNLRFYMCSDYAMTPDGGDFTVHGCFGVDRNGDAHIVDWFRDQVDSRNAVEAGLEMAGRWHPMQWAEDKSQVERGIGPFLIKRAQELGIYCHRQAFSCTGNKTQRAQAFQGRMAQGKVFLPSNAPWVADLIYEMMQFDNGKYDDQVDVLSLFGRMLATMSTRKPNTHPQLRVIRGHQAQKEYLSGRRRV